MSESFDAEAQAISTYPHEHVGYSRPAPPNCGCDECYVNDQRRLAFVAGASWLADALTAPMRAAGVNFDGLTNNN